MLQKVSIQNFKSLKDVTLELQKVNLLIGPNNSGKSNFLKALELLSNYVQSVNIDFDYLINCHHRHSRRSHPITITTTYSSFEGGATHYVEMLPLPIQREIGFVDFVGRPVDIKDNSKIEIRNLDYLNTYFEHYNLVVNNYSFKPFNQFVDSQLVKDGRQFNLNKDHFSKYNELDWMPIFGRFFSSVMTNDDIFKSNDLAIEIGNIFYNITNIPIYRINPSDFMKSSPLNTDSSVIESASNLVSFLDNIKEENPSIFSQIEKDLNSCIPEFKHITLPKTKAENGYIEKKIKLLDENENGYWADEVSEGVLYFLALLCIVHQPNPPKLLLLEEPEKGIHPRRIHEVMKFIFQLAEDKDIQVIMTSHNEHVLEEFALIPEAVFIFDKDDEGATFVKNLKKDVIEPDTKKAEEFGIEPIDFTDNIGENWFMGLMGGVPA